VPFEAFVAAVDAMESAFQAKLFCRDDWSPTRQGLTIAKRGRPLVDLMTRAFMRHELRQPTQGKH
jgi:hypothetical protein